MTNFNMKKQILTLIPGLCAALLIAGCGKKAETSGPSADQPAAGEDKEKQIAELRAKLIEAEKKANEKAKVEIIETPVNTPGSTADATAIIKKLADPAITGEDAETQRKVIHMFESLVEGGNNSVAAIDQFLGDNLDREFGRKSTQQQLGITTAQMTEIRETATQAFRENMGKMMEIRRNENMSREEREEATRALWEGTRENITNLLTDEQKAKIEAMEGGEGDFIRGLMRGGFGRGGFGGDGGRGPGGRGPGGRGPGGR